MNTRAMTFFTTQFMTLLPSSFIIMLLGLGMPHMRGNSICEAFVVQSSKSSKQICSSSATFHSKLTALNSYTGVSSDNFFYDGKFNGKVNGSGGSGGTHTRSGSNTSKYKADATYEYVDVDVVSKDVKEPMKTFDPAMFDGSSLVFPVDYQLIDHWHYLTPKQKICETEDIPAQVAFQCVNKRGAIAHGRDPELSFDVLTMDRNPFKSVREVFDDLGGTKLLKDTEDIKRELMTRGPVISTSFQLTEQFMVPRENANRFDPALIGQKYPVVIVGWEHTPFGEVWIIQPLINGQYSDVQKIAFSQFNIDKECIAPSNTFEQTPWQVGPYFDIDMSDTPFPEWCSTWGGVETAITSKEMEKIGELLGEDLLSSAQQRQRFVVRDVNKISRSRACFLTKLEWQPGDKPWRMEVSYQ